MHRVCFDIAGLTIYWYGVMMAVGFLAGWTVWQVLGRTRGYDKAICSDLLFWVVIAGLLGARAAYVIENWSEFAARPQDLFAFRQGGVVFYGGFIGAALALVLYAKVRRLRLLPLFDLGVTGLPLAHAFGRVGCFLNGCCWGSRTDSFLGVCFPKDSLPWFSQRYARLLTDFDPRSLPVHAVQLYESVANLLIFAVVVIVYRRARHPGVTTGVYGLLYACARTMLEHFRGDRGERAAVGGFSIAQAISVLVAIAAVAIILAGRNGSREAHK